MPRSGNWCGPMSSDGPTIDLSKWSYEVNGQGGGNNELQYYTARTTNAFVDDGKLVIQALEERYTGSDGTRDYTSARLRTLNQGDWRYGRFEIRARLPVGQGLWPAIWMLPTDWVYGGWAASGEIDVMEYLGHDPARIYGTLHYGGGWPNNVSSGGSYAAASYDFSTGFHTFTMEWEEDEFRWYVDGTHYHTETAWYSSAAAYPAPFNQQFHLLLNVAVGGNWPGDPDGTTVFPQRMEVDYVRVYQRSSDPGPATVISGSETTRIQAENYAMGGEGNGYHDSTAGNAGAAYRSDDVDIEGTADAGGGYNVGWMDAGEWLAYPVKAQVGGLYGLRVRAASLNGGGSYRMVRDVLDQTGASAVPATGSWQNWTTLTHSNVFIRAGTQTLRFYVVAGGFNFNWFELVPPAPGQDSDGDGMIDAWELQYSGHPTNMAAAADMDLDFASNLDEYIADTDPTNRFSRMAVTGFWSDQAMHFSIDSASTARIYRLQINTAGLDAAGWSNVVSGLVPSGPVLSVTDSNAPVRKCGIPDGGRPTGGALIPEPGSSGWATGCAGDTGEGSGQTAS